MKKLLLLICFLTFLEGKSQTIHRIMGGMNLQTEIDNASAGDTFIVEVGSYGNITINKRILLFGTGYFNYAPQASSGTSMLGRVYFKTSSDGSVIQGFKTGSIDIGASNILVARNNCTAIRLGIDESDNNFNQTTNGVIIKQNFVSESRLEIAGNNGAVSLNFIVKNNIFNGGFMLAGNIIGDIINNTFNARLDGVKDYYSITTPVGISVCTKLNITLKNNIIVAINTSLPCPITSYPPDNFKNNILQFEGIGAIFNNTVLSNQQVTELYLGYPNNANNLNIDARNQLAPNSPAKGAGEGGTDAGAFGGDDPYILSGIPSVPTIYQLNVPFQV